MAPATYPLGRFKGTHKAQVGGLLIPQHLTRDVLKDRRIEMGETAYAALTQTAVTKALESDSVTLQLPIDHMGTTRPNWWG